MLELLEGIRVIDYHSTNSEKPRAWINPGTSQSIKESFPGIQYSENAFIPIELWRELNPVEQRLLYRNNSEGIVDKSNHIGIVYLPDSITAPLVDLGVAFVQNTEDCHLLSQHPLYQEAIDCIVEYLLPLCSSKESLTIHHVGVNPSGLPTVTFNHATNRFIGLHLDSWDGLPIENRYLSTNRICINLGFEDRFLLFVNLTLMDIFYLSQIDIPASQMNSVWENRKQDIRDRYFSSTSTFSQICLIELRHDFLTKYPNYPVIKLRISPGEAYIAPTENMIHDGCTIGKTFFDVSMTVRGHIGLPSFKREAELLNFE